MQQFIASISEKHVRACINLDQVASDKNFGFTLFVSFSDVTTLFLI